MPKTSLDKNSVLKQEKFIEALEGLGDILVVQTENHKNSDVIPSLGDLGDLLKSLLGLRDTNPAKFDQLMLDKDYWKHLNKNKREAQLRLELFPEKHLVTFSLLLKQIIRVFEASIKVNNAEAMRHATYQLVYFLNEVSSMKSADILVKEILRKLLDFSRKSISVKSDSAHSSTYHWYADIVFNKLGRASGKFQFEYLPLFNQYFFESIKYLVSQGEFEIYKQLIGHLVDGIIIPEYQVREIWDYDDFLANQDRERYLQVNNSHKITNKIQKLDDTARKIYSNERLSEWLSLFEELKEIIYPELSRVNKTKANKLEKKIKGALYQCYANQNLVAVLFYAGAWALYKGQPKFITEMWNYKQPHDARASYGGNDIFPQGLLETVDFYFEEIKNSSLGFFWEDHHDSEKYKQTYFLLILLLHLKPIKPYMQIDPKIEEQKKYPEIEEFSLPFSSPQKLADVKFIVEGLITTAEEIKETSLLTDLKLSNSLDEANELIDEKLKPFLKRLIESAEEKTRKIKTEQVLSDTRITEFKSELIKTYKKFAVVREIFKDSGALEDKTSDGPYLEQPFLGYHQLERREMFFDEWHVDYGDFAENYGRQVAESENSHLLSTFFEILPKTSEPILSRNLDNFEVTDKTVIFASDNYIYDYLEGNESFIPFWREQVVQEKEPYFEGRFNHNNKKVKVYSFNLTKNSNYFMLLNVNSLGKIVQYSPLLEGESEDDSIEHLRVKIRDFATNEKILFEFLNSPPPWLQKVGERQNQEEYLKQFIHLQIGVKFKFIPSELIKGVVYT